MRRYRLLIILMVALSLLLVMSVTAGAAPFSDVEADSRYAPAFQLLKDLEIFQGYGDGTVGPNDPLTREQFAVIAVRVLGATGAAENLSNYVTHFTDDAQISDWARGAVVYASTSIVQGYPDGTFRPQASVTYAEAYAMLIRALGLEPAVEGPWPIGVINLAHEIGLSDGISGDANAPMTRGDMALATEIALLTSIKWNSRHEELDWLDDGSASLIVNVHGWSPEDWAERVGILWVTGRFERVTAAGDIRIDGKDYVVENYEALVVELNDSILDAVRTAATTGFLAWNQDHLAALFANVEPEADHVTLALDRESGKVKRVKVYVDTFPNYELTRITVQRGETEFGTVGIKIPGQPAFSVNVTADTEVWVNGEKATLAEAQKSLDEFRSRWRSNTNAVITVRTFGNKKTSADLGPGEELEAIWLSIITDKVVSGTVAARGADSGGQWVHIDGVKYYAKTVDPLEVGDEVTVLLGHDDAIYVVLDGAARGTARNTTFARVIGYTVDSRGNYVTTFRLPDKSQMTLRIQPDGNNLSDKQKAIDAALATAYPRHNLVLLIFDEGELDEIQTLDQVVEHSGKVTRITSTQITIDGVPYTLADDVFYWDKEAERFIDRADISADDEVEVYTYPDGGIALVGVVILLPDSGS